MKKRPTIRMIAQQAQVSRGTVDRVLNQRAHVSAEVRQRVLEVIAQLGYVPPRQAQDGQTAPLLAPLRLGVLLPNWEGFFRSDMEKGIQQAEAELGDFRVQILTRRCATTVPAEAVELLAELAELGCQGLAVCALNDGSIARKLSQLAEEGIPCVTFNSDLPESGRLCYVGQDILREGRLAGELMSRCVPPGSDLLVTLGNLKFDGHFKRLEGFRQRLEERGFSPKQLHVRETFNDYETTFRVVSQALEEHPELGGVYMANLSVPACAEAIRQAGLQGKIRVICHDENETTRRLLREGLVDFTIPQDMVQQGRMALVLLREYLQKGILLGPERFVSRIAVVCAENLQPDAGY